MNIRHSVISGILSILLILGQTTLTIGAIDPNSYPAPKIGLALGGGSAGGFAHIGVLKVLEEAGIHIDMISGTSMGAVVGGIYAATASVEKLKQSTIDLFLTRADTRRKIFDYTLPKKGLLKGEKAAQLVRKGVNNADFLDLMIPTYLVGVDILNEEEVIFETGDVTDAVRSSIAIPAVFAPFKHQGRWMVDGGLLNPVPVDVLLRKGADMVRNFFADGGYQQCDCLCSWYLQLG